MSLGQYRENRKHRKLPAALRSVLGLWELSFILYVRTIPDYHDPRLNLVNTNLIMSLVKFEFRDLE